VAKGPDLSRFGMCAELRMVEHGAARHGLGHGRRNSELLAQAKMLAPESTGAGMSLRFDDLQDPAAVAAPGATDWPDGQYAP